FVNWLAHFLHPHSSPTRRSSDLDFGIYQRAFFTDLSANPEDADEYRLHDEILETMNANGIVLGWHSYKKDTEGQHVTLVSHHARSEEHTSELQSRENLVCRLLLE